MNKNEKHIFYLHGAIIESQGIEAVSSRYGAYRYTEIIDSLKSTGATVHNVVRTTKTDFFEFCKQTSDQIDSLVNDGVRPEDISVIGASKGGIMTMHISDMNQHPVNYIVLAANSDRLEQSYDLNLHGRILGVYESSDRVAGKHYEYWIEASTNAKEFKHIEINTGLGHGFLYRPIKEWFEPAKAWMGLE